MNDHTIQKHICGNFQLAQLLALVGTLTGVISK